MNDFCIRVIFAYCNVVLHPHRMAYDEKLTAAYCISGKNKAFATVNGYLWRYLLLKGCPISQGKISTSNPCVSVLRATFTREWVGVKKREIGLGLRNSFMAELHSFIVTCCFSEELFKLVRTSECCRIEQNCRHVTVKKWITYYLTIKREDKTKKKTEKRTLNSQCHFTKTFCLFK